MIRTTTRFVVDYYRLGGWKHQRWKRELTNQKILTNIH